MAPARPTSAKSLLRRRTVLRSVICLTGILAVTILPGLSSKTQIRRQSVVRPAEIQLSSRTLAAALIEPLAGSVTPAQRPLKPVNHASTKAENDVTIIPIMDVVVLAPHLWADGQTPAVVYISLKEIRGNETWNFSAREEMVFQLEPRTAGFVPSRVRIAPGATTSEPASLTAKKPEPLQLTCTPERKYAGLSITNPQPRNIEFITPIDAIGIESASDTCQVNVAIPFEIFLYNKSDPNKTRLTPRSPISVQLRSESGNGKIITTQPVQLTKDEPSKYVDYVGTKTGADTIKAIASYEESQILGVNDRKIVFPLWIFLVGVIGSILGSAVRYYQADQSERTNVFFYSLFWGVVTCLLIILYPIGTKLVEISNYIQPTLMFVLGALASAQVPKGVNWIVSLIPKGGEQENG